MNETKATSSTIVWLDEVIDHMDLPSEEWAAYLNRHTGELVTVTDEDQRPVDSAEDIKDLPEWQSEALPKVREALESDDFLLLPGKFEIHEYRIMEHFSLAVEELEVREELLQAIRGRGAFRRFREVIRGREIQDRWYAFRQQALEDIAIGWLETNDIAYTRGRRTPSDVGA